MCREKDDRALADSGKPVVSLFRLLSVYITIQIEGILAGLRLYPFMSQVGTNTVSDWQCILMGRSGLRVCGWVPERSDQLLELRVVVKILQVFVAHKSIGILITMIHGFH